MPDFIDIRDALNTSRTEHEAARLSLLSTSEKIKLLERSKSALMRSSNPDNTGNAIKQEELDSNISQLKEQLAEKKSAVADLAGNFHEQLEQFKSFTDPRVQLNRHFNCETPFLLFPTRLETRFKKVVNPDTGVTAEQLCVRVYPDTCMVDSFDPQLSDEELRNAARFWAEYYAAGDVLDANNPDPATLELQKAAWAFIAKLEGPGRASYILKSDQAKPQPGSIFPKRTSGKTVILTIATEDESVLTGLTATVNFIKKLWLADKNAEKVAQAKQTVPNPDELIEKFLPVNFDDPLPQGLKKEDADLQVALVLMPEALDATGKTNSWSQAAHVPVAPERFVLLGYKGKELVIEELGNLVASPLYVGIDPNNTENNFSPTENGDLEIPADVKWIVDFEEAVARGMGFKVNLNPTTRNGVDRLLVLGLRLSADESEKGGQQLLTDLFDHHYSSSKGFSILPQGSPTNNTEKESAVDSGEDDRDATFARYFREEPAFKSTRDWQAKHDGQWLSEWLGIEESFCQKLLHADGLDQADAINMNHALWTGTLGYALDAMMDPVFSDRDIRQTRQFFSMFVTGRGGIPNVRIGNQPYGILPTTAFRRQRWMYPRMTADTRTINFRFHFGGIAQLPGTFLRKLYELLLKMDADWHAQMVPSVPHISAENPGHTHQQLLDIVGLTPTSIEYYHRYLQTLEMLFSFATFSMPFGEVTQGFDKMEFGLAFQLLRDLGYDEGEGAKLPLLSTLYGMDKEWEHKVVIDTVPLSEKKPIRSYTADGRNYIRALIDAANTSMDALRNGQGLTEKPGALLYAFLKFSLEEGYFDTSVNFHEKADLITATEARAIRTEAPFLHMNWNEQMTQSRYAMLYKQEDKIASNTTVADHISALSNNLDSLYKVAPGLAQQLGAMKHLENIPTARLERALAEHLDCCSYRLDAWEQAVIKLQLTQMRGNTGADDQSEENTPTKKGIYLGAFGWLENVKPETDKILAKKEVPAELKELFPDEYVTDQANAGFVHAPSVNHAVTAAVLRNAYLNNGKKDNTSAFAVNLSSERIRLGLSVIEGIQNGQSLAALLGYRFERSLHDQLHLKDKGIDTYIYALRKQFPLNAEKILDTRVANDPSVDPDTIPISAIEARNVVHGKRLIDHVRNQSAANKKYPFGFAVKKLPFADNIVANAITEAVNGIMNIEDSIADLGLAESVHQVCLGNYDRAAGVLESYSNGNYPQTPDVVRTPRSGPTLTHRVGIPIEFVPTVPFEQPRPRKSAEPSLNKWAGNMLPAMDKIICQVRYTDRTDDTIKEDLVSMADLGLAPVDLLYLLHSTGEAALGDLDEMLIDHVFATKTPRLDTELLIRYILEPQSGGRFSVFEIMPLVGSLRAICLESGNLKPQDIQLPGEASMKTEVLATLDRARVDAVVSGLDSILQGSFTTNVLDVLKPLAATPSETESEDILQHVDDYLNDFAAQLRLLRRFGLPQTGVGGYYRRRQELTDRVREKVLKLIDTLAERKAEYETLEAGFNPADPDAIEQLQNLEALVSAKYSDLDVIALPAVQAKKALFDAKVKALRDSLDPKLIDGVFKLVSRVRNAVADLADFTLETFDITEEERQIVRFVLDDLKPAAESLFDSGKKAIAAATDALIDLGTYNSETRAQLIETAAKAIFGEEFRMIPRYELQDQFKFEMDNAWNSPDLLDFLKNVHNPAYFDPAEDWLHGIARVRGKMHHAENILLLREAFGLGEDPFVLHPVQFPFKSDDYHWMAMPIPEGLKQEDGETLLYTALADRGASAPQYACGFLVDEWTEVIPQDKETTGLTFHYDRPNSEAPQTMLLVTPATLTGKWEWQDIVDSLHYTLDAARLRGVEPFHVDKTAYARYLPALISPAPRHPITIGMYLREIGLKATEFQL